VSANECLARYTRALLHAALEGKLENVKYETDAIFGLAIPQSCEGYQLKF
jgi:phosphoenolpyruvate carboxykinase (ATP)